MNLAALPDDFPLLAIVNQKIAIQKMSIQEIGIPPDIKAIGERTYIRFALAQVSGNRVDQRYWRYLPYAMWLEPERCLSENAGLISEYLKIHLPQSLKVTSRSMKWAEPLFYTYLLNFKPNDPVFEEIAQATDHFFSSDAIAINTPLKKLALDLSLFKSGEGPYLVANSVLKSRLSLEGWVKQFGLWPDFVKTTFSLYAFMELLKIAKENRRQIDYVRLVFEWLSCIRGQFHDPVLRTILFDALLLPWAGLKPPEDLKKELYEMLILNFENPVENDQQWQGISVKAKDVFMSWGS